MQTLRTHPAIARLVLVWFALFTSLAAAAPWLHPQDLQLICSASGGKLLSGSDAGRAPSGPSLDCPLCAGLSAPPPLSLALFSAAPPATAVPAAPPQRMRQATSATPPPARAPPALA